MADWKTIEGFPNYAVSEDGQVKNQKRNRILKQAPDSDGYLVVSLYYKGNRTVSKVHRLVAKAFIPNPDNLPGVNHIDEIKSHNWKSNLEWSTCEHNSIHSFGKTCTLISPDGKEVSFKGINRFCKEIGLPSTSIRRLLDGKTVSCNGWTKPKPQPKTEEEDF